MQIMATIRQKETDAQGASVGFDILREEDKLVEPKLPGADGQPAEAGGELKQGIESPLCRSMETEGMKPTA